METLKEEFLNKLNFSKNDFDLFIMNLIDIELNESRYDLLSIDNRITYKSLAYEACINSRYYMKILNKSELIKYFGVVIRGSFFNSTVKILKNELL